jgi:hypothetical protein
MAKLPGLRSGSFVRFLALLPALRFDNRVMPFASNYNYGDSALN